MNKSPITISLTPIQLEAIDKIAAKYQCSRSAVVRKAIVDLIKAEEKGKK